MKAVVIILSILLVIACLVFGFLLGNTTTPTKETTTPAQNPQPTSTRPPSADSKTPAPVLAQNLPSNPQQHNLIFIQADNLTSAAPRLESIWLLAYIPGSPRVTLLLVYPAQSTNGGPKSELLARAFSINSEGKLGDDFITAIKAYHFEFENYFISDEQGTAELVDWLGGIDLGDGGGVQKGPAILANLVPPWDNLEGAMAIQQKLSTGICAKANQIKADSNWMSLALSLMPDHLHTDLSLESAAQDWKQIMGNPAILTCKIALP